MSNHKLDIDRLYRKSFDSWEAPHDPGEAHEVFDKVQQNLPDSGSNFGNTGDGGSSVVTSGSKGLIGGAKTWIITGISGIILSTGVGYFLYDANRNPQTANPSTYPEDSVQEKQEVPDNTVGELSNTDQANPLNLVYDLASARQPSEREEVGQQPSTPRPAKRKKGGSSSQSSVTDQSPAQTTETTTEQSNRSSSIGKQTTNTKQAESPGLPELVVRDTALCPHQRLKFSIKGLVDSHQVTYRIGNSRFRLVEGRHHAIQVPAGGKDEVPLIVRIDNGAVLNDTINIQLLSEPHAAFEVTKPGPQRLTLKAESKGAVSHHWLLGNGEMSRQSSLTCSYRKPGVKEIRLIATAANGCMDTASDRVRVKPGPKVEIPNIFTPNGDGRNDKLNVKHGDLETFELTIKKRNGQVVFQTSDPDRAWNGNLNNSGKQCNEGAYQFVLRYKYPYQERMQKQTGKLLLKRTAFK